MFIKVQDRDGVLWAIAAAHIVHFRQHASGATQIFLTSQIDGKNVSIFTDLSLDELLAAVAASTSAVSQ